MTISDNPTRDALSDIRSWQEARRTIGQAAQNAAEQYGYDPIIIRHQIARLSFGTAARGARAEHMRKVLWKALEIATTTKRKIP